MQRTYQLMQASRNRSQVIAVQKPSIPKAEQYRGRQADVICRCATPLLGRVALCASRHLGTRESPSGHLWLQASILSHRHSGKTCGNPKEEPKEMRENSRNFREKIHLKYRDPLQNMSKGGVTPYRRDCRSGAQRNTARVKAGKARVLSWIHRG